ncbi:MAG: hypothetical protein AAF514_23720, partial [Verrucomicrobiota bacterium]
TRIRNAGGSSSVYQTGLKLMGMVQDRQVAFSAGMQNPDALRLLLAGLEGNQVQSEEEEEAYRWRYQEVKRSIEDGSAKQLIEFFGSGPGAGTGWWSRHFRRLRFHERPTLRLLLNRFDRQIRNVALPVPQRESSLIGPAPKLSFTNFYGEQFVQMCSFGVSSSTRAQAQSRMHLLAAALRLCEMEKGQLPESVEALVPIYLKAVPVDPYNGEPLSFVWAQDIADTPDSLVVRPDKRDVVSVGPRTLRY